jgi:predicted RNA-binding Zn-ribbon protein involved in translation (DUF1610 family)
MSKLMCPKCNEQLDEIIRTIQVRCLFDEEEDDYLTDRDEGSRDLCPKCGTELKD